MDIIVLKMLFNVFVLPFYVVFHCTVMCLVASSLLRMLSFFKTVETVMFQVIIYCNNNY